MWRLRTRDGGAPPRSEAAERVYDTIRKPLDGEISTEDFLCPAVAENFARQDVVYDNKDIGVAIADA